VKQAGAAVKAFKRIVKWLQGHKQAKAVLASLRQPATAKAIRDFEARTKLKLPPALVAIYRLHHGHLRRQVLAQRRLGNSRLPQGHQHRRVRNTRCYENGATGLGLVWGSNNVAYNNVVYHNGSGIHLSGDSPRKSFEAPFEGPAVLHLKLQRSLNSAPAPSQGAGRRSAGG